MVRHRWIYRLMERSMERSRDRTYTAMVKATDLIIGIFFITNVARRVYAGSNYAPMVLYTA